MQKLIVIVGANASGKSSLGVLLAGRFNGEIVSADSRQVFRGLDLGSGKITQEEMRGVPHHLLDVCEPGDFFSMHDYQRLAYQAIDDIAARGRTPFLVGGTGLYVASVTEGYVLSDELYRRVRAMDPNHPVDPRNRNRVMRILEKAHDGDTQPVQNQPRYRCLKLGVNWEPEVLRARIDERLDRRLREGMIEEVQGLLDAGVSAGFLDKLGLEYRFITRYLTGEITSREEMVTLLGNAIKQFAKRQRIWFRRDREIIYLDMKGDPLAEAAERIERFLNEPEPV